MLWKQRERRAHQPKGGGSWKTLYKVVISKLTAEVVHESPTEEGLFD